MSDYYEATVEPEGWEPPAQLTAHQVLRLAAGEGGFEVAPMSERNDSEKRDDETQTGYTLRLLRMEVEKNLRSHLRRKIAEMDETDDYHDGDFVSTYHYPSPEARAFEEGVSRGYYAAQKRIESLLLGEISDWTDAKP